MMNPSANYTQHYRQQSIETASKEQLLLMLFDGAIKFLKIAKKAMAEGDRETSNNHLIKTQKIVVEFMSSLDVKMGGEVAENLLQLYEYLYHQLVQCNIKQDESIADEVLGHLMDLRRTWAQAIQIAAKEAKESSQQSSVSA